MSLFLTWIHRKSTKTTNHKNTIKIWKSLFTLLLHTLPLNCSSCTSLKTPWDQTLILCLCSTCAKLFILHWCNLPLAERSINSAKQNSKMQSLISIATLCISASGDRYCPYLRNPSSFQAQGRKSMSLLLVFWCKRTQNIFTTDIPTYNFKDAHKLFFLCCWTVCSFASNTIVKTWIFCWVCRSSLESSDCSSCRNRNGIVVHCLLFRHHFGKGTQDIF